MGLYPVRPDLRAQCSSVYYIVIIINVKEEILNLRLIIEKICERTAHVQSAHAFLRPIIKLYYILCQELIREGASNSAL